MAGIIVTGSSRGIGYQLVRLLSENGHQVLALSRNSQRIEQLNLPRVHSIAIDLENPESCGQIPQWIATHWGKASTLIHNAGALVNKPFASMQWEDFEKVYRVNVFGVAELTRLVLPVFEPEGHIVAISSMGGIQGSAKFPGLAAYSSSKGAVITLMELLAEEYKETGPSFNTLALGAVQTEMLEEAFPGYKAPLEAHEMAAYIADFALTGHRFYNGKVLQVSSSTP
ncbi:Short-chain dehydrogenase [Robiginitalea myxolifaciens]|uniref:Short-chain dehydrogenase n=1 Tax=Robiginitalea myxolifaciens TaxID=400055 RepID=A0A1I6HJG6_9FLAO|nr:SDR family oxidoreductase [Robiginitalea myxolifaciens]SFR54447.1 Short-chain dehydrogenase [Robiginitalea myxolifaciens]